MRGVGGFVSLLVGSASSSDLSRQSRRNLQGCKFADHANAIECTEISAVGNDIRYLLTCPSNARTVGECLIDATPVCYQYNQVPCLRGFYCANGNRLSLDCSNIFSKSFGDDCSRTDCFGSCISLVEHVVPYTKVVQGNPCMSLGYVSSCQSEGGFGCAVERSEWIDVLEDSTRIYASISRNANGQAISCQARTSRGFTCSCQTSCPNTLAYDCSAYSFDVCAKRDCQGNCINHELYGQFSQREIAPPPQPSPITVAAGMPAPIPIINFAPPRSTPPTFAVRPPPFANLPDPVLLTTSIVIPPWPWTPSEPEFGQAGQSANEETAQPASTPPFVPLSPGVVSFTVTNPEFLSPEFANPLLKKRRGNNRRNRDNNSNRRALVGATLESSWSENPWKLHLTTSMITLLFVWFL